MTLADEAVWFINNLTLSNEYRGQPMVLRPWQEDIVRKLNTVGPDGLLQYRRALLMIPRKQSKTQLSACIAVHHLLGTGKQGQTVLCAAGDLKQAKHLWEKVLEIIQFDEELSSQCRILLSEKVIETRETGNKLIVLSSDPERAHGHNPSLVILDEVWTQKNRLLYNALTSGFAARTEHLTLLISTQGNRRDSLIYEQYEYAKKVRDGVINDPKFLPIIYELPESMDWKEEKNWYIAMPALGDFARLEYFRDEFALAKEIPSEESKFRQFYLNQLVSGEGKWVNRTKWDACGKYPVDPEALRGRSCHGGADLSAKSDISAVELVFPMDDGSYQVLSYFWIPKEYAKERDRKGYSKYQHYASEAGGKLITLTQGFYIDEDEIVAKIVELSKIYKIKDFRFDQAFGTRAAILLNNAGIKTQWMKPYASHFNEPLKYMETMIATEKLHHGNNAILNQHAENAVAKPENNGQISLDKANSNDKIDGIAALAMAMAGAMVASKKKSVYETRGLLTLG